ncbi:D-2-hydroxyacid dehydrogenase [Natronomonas sp. EA1]|uniref:D-2-hydroxyacid dehydrogenase n=1 Tax=Natronomonas sp. EA1 TaxID=3421655 RepID=UPI003EB6F96C
MHIVVLRSAVSGRPIDAYVDALRDRLPDHEISHARTPDEERALVAEADVVTGPTLPPERVTDSLKLFAGVYAGSDHIDLEAFAAHEVPVTSAAGVHTSNVAEYAIGGLITLTQEFTEAFRQQERREWRHFGTSELYGSTVTIVGLGAIGRGIAERLEPFGVETVGIRASPEKGGPTDEVLGPDHLHDALARSDSVVLACPLTDETEGLLGSSEFVTMPAHATLVNVARGPVVDTDALVDALRWEQIAGAVLDVTDPEPLPEDHPLWAMENVLLTPHIAGDTPHYFDRLADIVAENVARLERGEPLRNRVV